MRNVDKIKHHLLSSAPGDRVLDIGCAAGTQTMMLARQGLEVHGVDRVLGLVQRFRVALAGDHLHCHAAVADHRRLPYPASRFDAIVSVEVREHVPEPGLVAREAYRAPKPGGRACIAVPAEASERLFWRIHPTWVEDREHVHVFRLPDLLALLEERGFRIIRIEKQNFEWSVFWLVHSVGKSRFDPTGTPIEHQWLSHLMMRGWQLLDRLRIGLLIKWLGNRFWPKSVYLYAEKPVGG